MRCFRTLKFVTIPLLFCCFVYYSGYSINTTRLYRPLVRTPSRFVVIRHPNTTSPSPTSSQWAGVTTPTVETLSLDANNMIETSLENLTYNHASSKGDSSDFTENCKRQNNVMFLKTHKTASSAVQNILLRYGVHHNLTFVLPKNKHDFGYPGRFNTKSIFSPKGLKPSNILCHHMRFNQPEVTKVMPPYTFYFSIVREPGSLFESMFDYLWELVPAFKRVGHGESPEKWLDKAEEYFRSSSRGPYWFFAKNPLMYDFGYDNTNETEHYIKNVIQEIEKQFDLILVSDYYEESMVLLSDALCWSLDEVACLSLNARPQSKVDSEAKSRLSEKARRWNRADAALFDHFNATLWQKIEKYGFDRMRRKLMELKKIKRNLTEICIEGGEAVDSSMITDPSMLKDFFRPPGVAVRAYNLRKEAQANSLCRELVMPENAFNNLVFNRQVNT